MVVRVRVAVAATATIVVRMRTVHRKREIGYTLPHDKAK